MQRYTSTQTIAQCSFSLHPPQVDNHYRKKPILIVNFKLVDKK
ncbi:hypothetical protein TREVI0001_0367 [Treponema vincentii ATCC 35580]|uniref:Uncharacterized protein n=1 Tax=Treponema vincentii ATCC 35580 TaxID=596324 RepID=C8PTF0_9SPIR|nr:hypothetical protein TREVI0001_0367 [Treponema vincentii ATCC 35580]